MQQISNTISARGAHAHPSSILCAFDRGVEESDNRPHQSLDSFENIDPAVAPVVVDVGPPGTDAFTSPTSAPTAAPRQLAIWQENSRRREEGERVVVDDKSGALPCKCIFARAVADIGRRDDLMSTIDPGDTGHALKTFLHFRAH